MTVSRSAGTGRNAGDSAATEGGSASWVITWGAGERRASRPRPAASATAAAPAARTPQRRNRRFGRSAPTFSGAGEGVGGAGAGSTSTLIGIEGGGSDS
ncbi:MAG TPA: hypothetical protein VLM85_17645, partial [Polyangiaceae bacterium]|nr:hypothetical protein [Polyangiaceae bacterium]